MLYYVYYLPEGKKNRNGKKRSYRHYTVTTVPLSVCYGALKLLVCMDASYFVPCACDRNGRTVLRGLSHLYFPFLGLPRCWGPMLVLFHFFL